MVSTRALDYGASGLGSSPRRKHCAVFLGKIVYSHSSSLNPRVQMDTDELLGKHNKLRGPGVISDGLASSLRKQPSFFAPGRVAFRETKWHSAGAKKNGCFGRLTSVPSRGSRNTSSRFMLQKPG